MSTLNDSLLPATKAIKTAHFEGERDAVLQQPMRESFADAAEAAAYRHAYALAQFHMVKARHLAKAVIYH